MKRLTSIVLALSMVALFGGAFVAKADAPRRDEAVVEFVGMVKLMDVLLQGSYVFVHDEFAMADGKACLYVYTEKHGRADKLVTSFHCVRTEKERAGKFTVVISNRISPYDVREIKEIQFAGRTESHKIPG